MVAGLMIVEQFLKMQAQLRAVIAGESLHHIYLVDDSRSRCMTLSVPVKAFHKATQHPWVRSPEHKGHAKVGLAHLMQQGTGGPDGAKDSAFALAAVTLFLGGTNAYAKFVASGARAGHFFIMGYETPEAYHLRPAIVVLENQPELFGNNDLAQLILRIKALDKAKHPEWFPV